MVEIQMGLGRERKEAWRASAALLTLAASLVACGGTSRHSSSSAAGSSAGGSSAGGSSAGGSVAQAGGAVAAGGRGGASASGAAGTAGAPPEPVDPFEGTTEEYWTQIVETELARNEECFGIPADPVMLDSSVVSAHFLVERRLKQRLRDVQPSIDAGFVRFDRQAAAECLKRMLTQSCEERLLDLTGGRECVDDALVGLVELGGACQRYIDCASRDQFCYYGPREAPPVCAPLSGPGQACDFIGCTPGNECVQVRPDPLDMPAFLCMPSSPKGEGEACSSSGSCADGLYCVNRACRPHQPGMPCTANVDCLYLEVCLRDATGVNGHCGRARGEGEPCQGTPFDNDCAFSFDCRANAQSQLVCTNVWVPVGELCRNTGSNGGIVCIDGYCDVISSANQQGVCVAAAQLGEECYSGSCAPGLECTEAGCQPETD